MIYKSYFRKKITKIYLIIFLFLFTIIGIILISKENFKNKINEAYSGSYLYFESNRILENIKAKNIKEIKKYLKINCNSNEFLAVIDEMISHGKVSIPNSYSDEYQINTSITCNINDINYDYILNDYYDNKDSLPIIYISKEDYQKISLNNNYIYLITLNDWSKYNKTLANLNKKYSINIDSYIKVESQIDYNFILNIINTFFYIFTILFIIVGVITTFNIINDEKNNNYLYYKLGFSKYKIFKMNLNKILLTFFISVLGSIIINVMINYFCLF